MKLGFQSHDGPRRSPALMRALPCVFLFLLQRLAVVGAAFQNLDFESSPSFLPPRPTYSLYPEALPSWTVHRGDTIQNGAWFNEFVLDAAGVALLTAESRPRIPMIGGEKGVYLQSTSVSIFQNPSLVINASISQVGDVPIGAQFLHFQALNQWYDYFPIPPGPLEVSLGGTILSLFPESSNGGFVQYAANVSPWAGQTTELSIRVLATGAWNNNQNFYEGWALVDNIYFTPSPAPEPSTVALIGFGGLLLVSSIAVSRLRNSAIK